MKASVSYRIWVIAIVILFIVPITNEFASALEVFTENSNPYGSTYGQWTAKWWTWVLSTPTNINQVTDTSGINCAQGQSGIVWFLAGTTGGHVERSCSIPSGKAILFPVVNTECSYAEFPKLKSESDLRQCAVSEQGQVTSTEVKVDGTPLQSSQMVRVQSPLFSFVFPSNNIFGAPAGPSQAVSAGLWVFLHPLTTGSHQISFKAVEGTFTTTAPVNSVQDVVYHLTVQ